MFQFSRRGVRGFRLAVFTHKKSQELPDEFASEVSEEIYTLMRLHQNVSN